MKTIVWALISAALLSGCARVATTTTLRPDGSYSRQVVYSVSKNSLGASMTGASGSKAPDKPEDFFKLPSNGNSIQVARSEDEQTLKVTVTRDGQPGFASAADISLLASKGKVMATSAVSVRKLEDGRIEYVETLHSLEPRSPTRDFEIPDLRARVKKALPPEFQKTGTIDAATQAVMANLAHALFGPPEPNLFGFFLSPEATARRVNAVAFLQNVHTFQQLVPSMTDDQAKAASRQLLDLINEKTLKSDPTSQASEDSGPNALTPLYFEAKFAGKVVETNGIVDPITGDVYWSLLAPVLDLGDVHLRLVIQP